MILHLEFYTLNESEIKRVKITSWDEHPIIALVLLKMPHNIMINVEGTRIKSIAAVVGISKKKLMLSYASI